MTPSSLSHLRVLWAVVTVVCAGLAPATHAASDRVIPRLDPSIDDGANLIPNVQDPQAVDAQAVCPGYLASNVVTTSSGLTASLALAGKACNVYGTDIDRLNLTVEYQSSDRLHVEIIPTHVDASNASHYILPDHLVKKPGADEPSTPDASDLTFNWTNVPSFAFSVTRRSSGDILFSTEGKQLVYENQFIEFSSSLPENYNLYGLGEVIHGLRLGNNLTRTIFAADVGDPIDRNIYGSHPFYLETRYYTVDETTGNLTLETGDVTANSTAGYVSKSHGVYVRNAHGQEVLLRPESVTWRALGGSLDLYFYAGPTQPDVTKSYLKSAAGLPVMQQYFALGYHQSRWGYANWSQLQGVVDNFEKFGIPLETIWTDIDYMNQYRDFENDQHTFPYDTGRTFLQGLHDRGQHYVPIVDSAVYIPNPHNESDRYDPFTRGNESGAFMTNPDGSLYIGAVWPGFTVFPDWLSAGAGGWWANELQTWHGNVSFDGIWIDMSEVSSFCVGSCGSEDYTQNPVHPPFGLPGEPGNVIYDYPEGFAATNASEAATASALASKQSAAAATPTAPPPAPLVRTSPEIGQRDVNYPPYVINNVNGDLATHAVSPNATHADGTQEYDVHNLFGHQILNATYHGLLNVFPGKRPFIIGRSTFVGSGMFAGHWGGDNYSQWRYMFFSIPQALSFALFGIPMFGVDTCGFQGNSDEELCNRWMQLSAFFPFYRNHNDLSALSQEPYAWASVIDATKTAMNIRFQLLPYFYTLMWQAHSTGSTVMRALAWEFPNDPSLAAADRQFLLGSSILITPVLTQGATSVEGVFPGVAHGELWYDWYTQQVVHAEAGKNTTIDAPLGHIPVFVRGGSVLPIQEPAMTTRDARKNPWGLIVALDSNESADGLLYLDDGESVLPESTLVVEFNASARTSSLLARRAVTEGMETAYNDTNPLANITIMGLKLSKPPKQVTLSFVSDVVNVGGFGSVPGTGAGARAPNATGGKSRMVVVVLFCLNDLSTFPACTCPYPRRSREEE
ncbi:MAG: hypothetical protein M1838_001573 [Thelocarpon superellum]|nr:MAG: hypothetical protein M1838_001573 [Thelocarpon superellum]